MNENILFGFAIVFIAAVLYYSMMILLIYFPLSRSFARSKLTFCTSSDREWASKCVYMCALL